MQELVTIATYVFPHELDLDRTKLESYGIECFTKDEMTVRVHNFYSNAIGGIKLQVIRENVQKAKELLSDHPDISTEYKESKLKCPNCDSGNVGGIGLNGKISMVILMLTGLPIPVFSNKYFCFECHEKFKLNKKAPKNRYN